jgi:hypothetical protein
VATFAEIACHPAEKVLSVFAPNFILSLKARLSGKMIFLAIRRKVWPLQTCRNYQYRAVLSADQWPDHVPSVRMPGGRRSLRNPAELNLFKQFRYFSCLVGLL